MVKNKVNIKNRLQKLDKARLPCLFIIIALQLCFACSKKPQGPLAFVSNEKDGTITVIDTATDTLVSTIQVGARPRGIRISPDGKLLYVALSYPSNKREGEDKIAAIDIGSQINAAHAREHRYSRHAEPEPLYTTADVKRLLPQFRPLPFDAEHAVAQGVSTALRPAPIAATPRQVLPLDITNPTPFPRLTPVRRYGNAPARGNLAQSRQRWAAV